MTEQQPPQHDQLPLPDYDHLPIGSLEARVRTLDLGGVEKLLAYEQAHANRLPAVNILQRRIESLESGAEPTGGSPLASTPEAEVAPPTTSSVDPSTSGPPVNPPSHGDPTNPAQPRG
jgi:hypothetical protein